MDILNQIGETSFAKYEAPELKVIEVDTQISFVLSSNPPIDPWGLLRDNAQNI